MAPSTRPARLVEGIDYYLERGKLVFSTTYHLKRGYCCHSRCRHCPYGTFGPPVHSPEFEQPVVHLSTPPRRAPDDPE